MRSCLVIFSMIVICPGCDRAEEARRKAVRNDLRQIELALKNGRETDLVSDSEFSQMITAETVYYANGPQQGQPPDGRFSAGTKVNVIEQSGSHVLVKSDGGIEAYVAAHAVRKQKGTAVDVSGIVEGGNQLVEECLLTIGFQYGRQDRSGHS